MYDAFGRRQRKTIDGTITDFVYDGLNAVRQATASSVVDVLTGLGVEEFLTRTDGATTEEMLGDALGSTIALTDGSGATPTEYSYEPFGAMTASGTTSGNEFRYTAREDDGTELYYYRARYYHPGLQRFVSEDPIRFGGGDFNVYAHVANSPLDLVDPSGLDKEKPCTRTGVIVQDVTNHPAIKSAIKLYEESNGTTLKGMRVYCGGILGRWMVGDRTGASTMNTVFLQDNFGEALARQDRYVTLSHEFTHVRQYRDQGYLWNQTFKDVFRWQYGYFNSPLEVEAEMAGAAFATRALGRSVRPDFRYGNTAYR